MASEPQPPLNVPVTIITGSLGAGKTSMITHILTAAHGRRICVIENEFAESGGIESLLLTHGPSVDSRTGAALPRSLADGYYELANGCACCTVRDGLVRTLKLLMTMESVDAVTGTRSPKFDHILIETSGLADPAPLASMFFTDLDEDAGISLDGVVTLVDAIHVHAMLQRVRSGGGVNETASQIALADVIVINKIDLLHTADDLTRVQHMLTEMNPTARQVTCSHGAVAVADLLHLDAYALTRPPPLPACDACSSDAEHVHDASVGHVTVTLTGEPCLRSRVDAMFAGLLWGEEAPPLTDTTAAVPHIVQTVLEQYDVQPLASAEALADVSKRLGAATSRLVFIGVGLQHVELERRLATCQQRPAEDLPLQEARARC